MPDNCTEEDIRLANGNPQEGSGRVEVCLSGHWGTVCDDGWDSNDATTVCRQLGYNETGKSQMLPITVSMSRRVSFVMTLERAIPTRRAYFGEGRGPIHISRAHCSSSHTRLTECKTNKTGINGCMHSEDAGVICKGTNTNSDTSIIKKVNFRVQQLH